jgi:hypothetical protein
MKKLSDYFWIAIAVCCISLVIFKMVKRYRRDHIAKAYITRTNAVLINDKNYRGNRSFEFSYSYTFKIGDKSYTGNSHDPSLEVGDTVEIEYNKNNPDLNRPLHPKE